jgi:ketosteroid isomerase-like protein
MEAAPDERLAILKSLDRLGSAVFARELDVARGLFVPEALVVGAEASEIAYGTEGVRAYFERMFERAVRYSFRWSERTVVVYGDVASLFANGVIVSDSEAGLHEHPYRVTGVLQRRDCQWLWAQYHGSEPAG